MVRLNNRHTSVRRALVEVGRGSSSTHNKVKLTQASVKFTHAFQKSPPPQVNFTHALQKRTHASVELTHALQLKSVMPSRKLSMPQ